MKKLFLLGKGDIEFSKEEILSLYKPDKYELFEDILLIDTDKDFSDRLALTKKVYSLIEVSKDAESSIEKIDWNRIIKGSYKVRCDRIRLEKRLADKIHEKLSFPKVDLRNPDTHIQIFFRNNSFIICILDRIVSTSWRERLPHMKPELSPTSLNPRIAKAMINLAGIPNGMMCDPFCGTGGLLVEAGLMKHKILGFDIDKVSIRKAKINLEHYDIKDYEIFHEDALNNNRKFDFVVTDLPYGLNTKLNNELEPLYKSFFEKYYPMCEVMIVGLPDFINHEYLIGNWKVEKEFTIYLHKSLSKKILKLKKNIN